MLCFLCFVYLYVLITKTEYPIQVYIAVIQSIQLRSIITFLFFYMLRCLNNWPDYPGVCATQALIELNWID